MRRRVRPDREPAPGAPSNGAASGRAPAPGDPARATSSWLAGYRVVRRLGSSARADLYLGHAGHREAEAGPEGGYRPVSVALKVFGPETDPASIEREIRALSQAPAGRLPELLDVATLPDGRVCLVLERLAGPVLSRHLDSIDRLEPGEAVTILAPVVAALSALHDAGFAHERLGQSSVRFDAGGRPVLTGLGALRDLPPAGASRVPALRADYLRLGVLIRGVFDRLDPRDPAWPAAGQLADWVDGRAADVPFRPCLDELERRLFDWAPATAVRLPGAGPARGADAGGADARRADARGADARRGGRAVAPAPMPRAGRAPFRADGVARERQVNETPNSPEEKPLPGWFAVFHLPPEFRAAVAGALAANPVPVAMGRLRDRARLRRRPLLLAAVLASALVLPALGLLPESPGPEQAGQEQAGPEPAGPEQAGAALPGTDSPAVAAPNAGSIGAEDAAALAGDDPAVAVPVLLRLRAGCLAAASVVCLDAIEQPGSAVMAADTYGARTAQQGGSPAETPTFERHSASLVERTGNSALVALAAPGGAGAEYRPASALVVKGEAGWRLRELFDY